MQKNRIENLGIAFMEQQVRRGYLLARIDVVLPKTAVSGHALPDAFTELGSTRVFRVAHIVGQRKHGRVVRGERRDEPRQHTGQAAAIAVLRQNR